MRAIPSLALLAVASLALLAVASPAAADTIHDEQAWFQTNVNVPVSPDLRVTLEQIARFSDRQRGMFQSEYGVLLNVPVVAKKIELGVGYRWVGAHNLNRAADENRFRVQMVGTFGRVFTRFRIDARLNPRGDEIGFRVRPLVRYNQPLSKKVALFATHESFLIPNSTSWGQRAGYERMRNTLGLAFPIGPQVGADFGYLNEFRLGRGGARAQMGHALSLQMTFSFKPDARRPRDESTH